MMSFENAEVEEFGIGRGMKPCKEGKFLIDSSGSKIELGNSEFKNSLPFPCQI